jgi:hypothetical protein
VPEITTEDYKAVILRLSHLAEASLSEAEIAKLQLRELRVKYEGKKAAKTDRRIISKAQVITGAEIMRLEEEMERKDSMCLVKKEKLNKLGIRSSNKPFKPSTTSRNESPTPPPSPAISIVPSPSPSVLVPKWKCSVRFISNSSGKGQKTTQNQTPKRKVLNPHTGISKLSPLTVTKAKTE